MLPAGILVCLIGAQLVRAQESAVVLPTDGRWQSRSWDTNSGLPQNTISDLEIDADGLLWVGTFGGLCRFDGTDWRACAPATEDVLDQRITALALDRDGSLLVGTELASLQRCQGGRIQLVAQLPGSNLSMIQLLADGRLVCGTSAGVYEVGAGGELVELLAGEVGPTCGMVAGVEGALWLAAKSGLLAFSTQQSAGQPAEQSAEQPAPLPGRACTAMTVMPDGRAVIGTDAGLFVAEAGGFATLANLPDIARGDRAVHALSATVSGSLWVATDGHLCRVPVASSEPALAFAVKHRVRSVCSDRGGGVWIGLAGGGLVHLFESDVALVRIVPADGQPVEPHAVLPGDAGGWLVATDSGLFSVREGICRRDERVGGSPVSGLARGAAGELWLGLIDAIAALHADQLLLHEAPSPGVGRVRSIFVDGDGRLWCGTDDGLRWFAGGQWLLPPPALALRGETVKLIVAAPNGDRWIATNRSLLCIDSALQPCLRLRHGEELPHGEVRAVLPGRNGRTWLGCYGGGFVAIDGDRRRHVSTSEGLFDSFVCAVVPSGDHWVVGSNRGTYTLDPGDLDRVVDGEWSQVVCRPLFGPAGALAEASGGVQPSAVRDGERVVLCGVGGLLVVDDERLARQPTASVCRIDEVHVGDRVQPVAAGDVVTFAAGDARVCTAVVTAPAIGSFVPLRLRWRLLPHRPTWSEPTNARDITFALDEPGEYTLEVLVWAGDGQPAAASARLAIAVAPRLWERTQFRFATVAALLALGLLAVRFGGRRAARRARHLAELVDERTVELRGLHAELEARVAQRTAELREALAQLEQDHDRRLELERELQQFQRMEGLGALAGSVAHDFNNLLTVVLGNASLLELELPKDGDQFELATRIREAAEQGRRLTRHLLTVASQQAVALVDLDLIDQLRGQRLLLSQLVGVGVKLQLDLADEPLLVRAAPSQIEQVLSNLCVNARDAMPHGGVLCITAARRDERIELHVTDTGVGMTEDVRRRVFDPFFTTKRGRRGTGLGLATVYGIVTQLGGKVTVQSQVGEGTTFSISLPCATEPTVVLPQAERFADPKEASAPPAPKAAGSQPNLRPRS